MRILEFENHHFGVEDIKEALTEMCCESTIFSMGCIYAEGHRGSIKGT